MSDITRPTSDPGGEFRHPCSLLADAVRNGVNEVLRNDDSKVVFLRARSIAGSFIRVGTIDNYVCVILIDRDIAVTGTVQIGGSE